MTFTNQCLHYPPSPKEIEDARRHFRTWWEQEYGPLPEYEVTVQLDDPNRVNIHVQDTPTLETHGYAEAKLYPQNLLIAALGAYKPECGSAADLMNLLWWDCLAGMWGAYGVPSQPPPPPQKPLQAGDANPEPCRKCKSMRGRIIKRELVLVRFCMLCGHEVSL